MQRDQVTNRRQLLVRLDVGGELFKICLSTVARFPNSLLAKMTQDFPSMVETGEVLYIDRNPTAFPWIHEIYRDGDHQSAMPNWQRERLQKELDFYQLPSLEELMPSDLAHVRQSRRGSYAEQLMQTILREIQASGLQDFFPWTILIYHQIVGDKLDPVQRVYVSPPVPLAEADYVQKRGHQAFDSALQMEGDLCPRQALGERSKLTPYNKNISFLIWKKGYAFIELLEDEAYKYGMEAEEAKAATFYLSNGKMVYGHFILDYKSSETRGGGI